MNTDSLVVLSRERREKFLEHTKFSPNDTSREMLAKIAYKTNRGEPLDSEIVRIVERNNKRQDM